MANFADNYLKKKKEKEKKKFSVSVTLGDKKVSVAAPGQTVKQQTQKVQQTAKQNAAAQRQQQAQKRVQAYQAQRASTSGKTAGSKNGTASQKSRMVSQPTAPEKKPFSMPTLPGAQMARERMLSPFSPMERNSSSWAYLQNAKTLARQTKKPQSYMDSLTQRQNALHQANVELAKRLPLRYNAQTGSWENTLGGQAAYTARVLPGVTAQTSIANSVPAQMARNQVVQMRQNGQTMLPKPAAEQLKDAGKELGGIAKDFGSAAVNAAKNAAFLAANSARGGLHQFNEGIYSTLDFFVPDFVPVVSDVIKYGKENAQKGAEKVRQENYARGTAAGIAGDVGAGLVSSLPSALAALASGGGSLAAELGSRSGAVVTAAKQVLKNPATWINAMQTYGPEYEKAKQGGASDAQAAANALISTLLQSGIEVSGGMETLGKTAKGAGRYIKSALEEGAEEVAQDIASRSVAALTYDKPQTLEDIYSKENPEALLNPVRMAQQGAMGAAVGGLYSGAHALGSRIGQHVSSTETKNKSTDQILDNRLQLPELLSDDTLVVYSIAQNTAGDKGLPLPDPGTLRQGIWMPGETKPRLKPEYESRPESRMRAPEEETMLQNQLAEVEKLDGFDLPEVQAHTTINTDPRTHTPEQMAQIQEYVDAVDDGLLDFAERYAEDPNAQFGRYTISKVSQRQADEISGILGIDVSGYQNAINKSGVNHILKRHGANGEADQSMAELSDISRMGYVLDNYDSVQPLTNEKGEFVTSTEFRGKDNAPAPMVRFAKKIDGTYYVVEAVADNRYKKLWVVSAYMEKSSPITQVLDAEKTAPSSQSSETPLASLESALIQSIPYQTMENKPADSGHIQAQEAHDGESGVLLAAWDDARQIRRRIEQAEQRMKLTDRDRAFVESALQTGSTANFYEADNPQDVQYLFELRAAERDAIAPVWEYNARQQEGMQREAAEDADTIAEFATDKKRGLYYLTETPERNLYDIFGKGNRDKAESFIRRYITPVHQAVAEGNRLANDMRSRVKALGLDKDESAVVQYLLENQAGGAEQYIREHKMKMSPQRQAKIDKAVAEFRDIYNELHRRIVETQIRNGYEPTEYRKNYAPHFVEEQDDKLLARVLYKLGMKITKKDQLPTDLAGVTETFRPGKKWFGNLERRQGNKTIYDAVKGFDQYIETAADVITLTDSIGRIRTLEDAVRYRLSDEGTQAKIDAIRADRSLDGLEKRQAMEKAYEDEPGKLAKVMRDLNEQKEMGMRNFVTELRRYGDSLAGKKSRGDRGIEDAIGRDIYEVSRAVEGRVAANMIGANPGSWLTNFIPLTQALGEVDTASMLKGLYQTVKAYAKDDGFVDASAFLTNRRGSDRLVKDTAQKVGDALGKPMEWFDQFTADVIVRARTAQNMNQKGMSLEAAIDEADAFAGSLMGDRSKGSMPGVFEMRNPVTKVFTMYQLEVNNQLRYMFKDLPRRLGEEGAAAVALGLTKMFTAAYVYNAIYRELTGRDAALDPIRMIQDALGGIGDEEDERTAAERAKELGMDAAEQLPFIGGLLGGGRVPVSSALPNVLNLATAITDTSKAPEKRWDMAKKELLKPAAYILPPFGGGAIKRAVEGYQTVSQGGAYSLNNEGERELMFPQYGQGPADYARAMLFGRWSTDQAQQYVESGFKRLNAEDTATYEWMTKERGIDPQKAYAVIQQVNGTKAPEDGSQSRKQAQREAIMALDLGWEDKVELDRRMIGGDDLISYTDAESFRVTNELPEREQAAAMRLMNDYGLSVDQAQKYAGMYGDFKTYTLNQNKTARWNYEDGSYRDVPMYTEDSKKVRLQKMRDAIEADSSLDDAQKEGILRTAILPELGDKYVSSYADDYIGGIDVGTLLDSQAAYERISEEVKKDMSIHEKNRSEYTRLRFDDYLESTGLSRAQQDKIWYFQSRGEDDLKMGWADLVRTGGEDIQKVGGQLEASGMDVTTYKVIKAGMDRIYSDKDANGNTIADSKKPKIIAYLNEYPELTNEQKNLLMIADGYKYGMGEKPKKSSSKKSSSGSSSKKSNPFSMKTAPKIKGLPLP